MTTDLKITDGPRADGLALVEKVVVGGDLAKLTPGERLAYYSRICQSLGLNPLTRPFQYVYLSGKLTLYAAKEATEQLRKLHGVSIRKLENCTRADDIYIVTAYAEDKEGREDVATGAVSISNLKGEALANAFLKAESKAKRRVTLSLCGLGMLDESEIGPGFRVDDPTSPSGQAVAEPVHVDLATGEIQETPPEPDLPGLAVEDQRNILMGQIRGAADKIGLKGPKRAELWRQVCGEATEANVDPAALHDLLKAIRALGKAAQ